MVSSNFPLDPDSMEASFVYDEVTYLSGRGVDVAVASRKSHGVRKAGTVDVFGLKCLAHHPISSAKRILESVSTVFQTSASYLRDTSEALMAAAHAALISQMSEEMDPDIIHAHFLYPEGWSACLACHLTGKPFVVTAHGHDLLTLREVGYGLRLKPQFEPLVGLVADCTTRIIASSDVLAKEAAKLTGRALVNKVVKVPNGVDTEKFKPSAGGGNACASLGIPPDLRIVVAAKSSHPVYGARYFLEAAGMVRREHPEARFLVAGSRDGSQPLRAVTRQLDLEDAVRFLGIIPRRRMPELLCASTVSVLPSLIEGGGAPLACLEAMACGKPVVASSVGGIPEAITDGLNGFLVPPRNSEAIAEKVTSLLGNSALAEEVGLGARKTVETRFGIQDRITRLIRVYEDVLGTD